MQHFPSKLFDREVAPADWARNVGAVFDGGLNIRKLLDLPKMLLNI